MSDFKMKHQMILGSLFVENIIKTNPNKKNPHELPWLELDRQNYLESGEFKIPRGNISNR